MPATITILEPIVHYELAVNGAVVVGLAADGETAHLDIRLAFDRWRFDSSTALGGRRITRLQAVEALRKLGRDGDECQITVDRCWRAAVIEARHHF